MWVTEWHLSHVGPGLSDIEDIHAFVAADVLDVVEVDVEVVWRDVRGGCDSNEKCNVDEEEGRWSDVLKRGSCLMPFDF